MQFGDRGSRTVAVIRRVPGDPRADDRYWILMWVNAVSAVIAKSGAARVIPPRGPLIVMYHGLGGVDGVDPTDFIAQLELLRDHRSVVPLRELGERLGDPTASDLAAITFDDGYVDFAEFAVPVLQKLKLHATLFVPSGLIGRCNTWDAGVRPKRQILSTNELRDLDPSVTEIGGHGFTHCRMAGLSQDALNRETIDCRRFMEDKIGRSVKLFAYPYGQRDDFDAAAEEAVARAGFSLACSTCFGRNNDETQRFHLNRVGINQFDDITAVERKLDGAYDWVRWKEWVGYRLRSLRRSR